MRRMKYDRKSAKKTKKRTSRRERTANNYSKTKVILISPL